MTQFEENNIIARLMIIDKFLERLKPTENLMIEPEFRGVLYTLKNYFVDGTNKDGVVNESFIRSAVVVLEDKLMTALYSREESLVNKTNWN